VASEITGLSRSSASAAQWMRLVRPAGPRAAGLRRWTEFGIGRPELRT
jgi:hypothetical protein